MMELVRGHLGDGAGEGDIWVMGPVRDIWVMGLVGGHLGDGLVNGTSG